MLNASRLGILVRLEGLPACLPVHSRKIVVKNLPDAASAQTAHLQFHSDGRDPDAHGHELDSGGLSKGVKGCD